MGALPQGRPGLFVRDGQRQETVIDGGRSFVNAEDDHDYEKPVYGVAGFTTDGKALLYDRYDVWALPLAGGPITNLTKGDGAKRSVRYRVTQLGRGGGGGAAVAVAAAAPPRRSRSI